MRQNQQPFGSDIMTTYYIRNDYAYLHAYDTREFHAAELIYSIVSRKLNSTKNFEKSENFGDLPKYVIT